MTTPSTLVEDVRKAICCPRGCIMSKANCVQQANYASRAEPAITVVLEAMREPSEHMMIAAFFSEEELNSDAARSCWSEMLLAFAREHGITLGEE